MTLKGRKPEFLTIPEAALLLRYEHSRNFLRAFRAAGYPVFGRPRRFLVRYVDVCRFGLRPAPDPELENGSDRLISTQDDR